MTRRRRYDVRRRDDFAPDAPEGVWHSDTVQGAAAVELINQERSGAPSAQRASQPFTGTATIQAADDRILPIAYGRNLIRGRVGPIYSTGYVLVMGVFYAGCDISGFEAIYVDENYGENIWSDGTHTESKWFPYNAIWDKLKITQYWGLEGQPVDQDLQAISGYDDDCIFDQGLVRLGQAYFSIVQYGYGSQGAPVVPIVILKGKPCLDPRTSQTAYTTTPALYLSDFLAAPYGANVTVDEDSVIATADMNDELVGARPRFSGGILIGGSGQPVDLDKAIDELRALAGCKVRFEGQTAVLVPDRPRSSVFTFGTSNIIDNSFSLSYRDMTRTPTRVEVAYTHTGSVPWGKKVASYDGGTSLQRRTTRYELPGVQDNAVAYRFAKQAWAQENLTPYEATWRSPDVAVQIAAGDVVTIKHGDYNGDMEVIAAPQRSSGLPGAFDYRFRAREYDPGVYSDDDPVDNVPSLPGQGDPFNPPPVASVSAIEVFRPDQANLIHSQVSVEFVAVDSSFVGSYEVYFVGAGEQFAMIANQQTPGTTVSVLSKALENYVNSPAGLEITVGVISRSLYGLAISARTEVTLTIFGKYRRPPNISRFTQALFRDNAVHLAVEPVNDVGGVRYLYRYSLGTDAGWDSAMSFNRQPTPESNFTSGGVIGDDSDLLWVYAKAVDSVGLESETAAEAFILLPSTDNMTFARVLQVEDVDEYVFTGNDGSDRICVHGEYEGFSAVSGLGVTMANRLTGHGTTTDSSFEMNDPWWWHMGFQAGLGGKIYMFEMSQAQEWTFAEERMRESDVSYVLEWNGRNLGGDPRDPPPGPYWELDAYSSTYTQTWPAINEKNHFLTERLRTRPYIWAPIDPLDPVGDQVMTVKFPVTMFAQRKPLVQTVQTTVTDGAFPPPNKTKTVNFVRPYSEPPQIDQFLEVSETDQGIKPSSVTATSITFTETKNVNNYTATLYGTVIGE